MPLTSAEIARARLDVSETLPDTCTIASVSATVTDGGWTETVTVAGSYACRVTAISVAERMSGGLMLADCTHVASLPAATAALHTDRVTHNGTTYEVIEVRQRSEELVRRVYLRGGVA